ncbi:hypothetical protein MSAN_01508400 [Mycena sanguinolenta]|uniref:Protein kinase domain-containing protein n=1 Tax=Mycena sanguinolenta TaxID=230812 RepID=A0A8H6Y5V6_9AGAR|nr:hypothetical protein MSAN_01508400 [Mycena sanguinolenta]
MDLHADSKAEVIVLSTSDNVESTPKHARNAKLFIKLFSFLPSLLRGSFKTSGTRGTYTRKYSETIPRRQAAERLVNNYNYYVDITGGFGGSGGEGRDQGGDGGIGQGPTVYFGQPEARESSRDVKLVKEVRLSPQSGVVGRQSAGVGVRRIYHAEICRDPETVTVAMYQGDGMEEEWRQHVAKYESIRHPNIMQLYGLVSGKGLHAMVFHDELIPYDQFFCRFEHSPILSTYIRTYCPIIKSTEWKDATIYIDDAIGSQMVMHSIGSYVSFYP